MISITDKESEELKKILKEIEEEGQKREWGVIVLRRFQNVSVDIDDNGNMMVYEPESGKIKCEGLLRKLYE